MNTDMAGSIAVSVLAIAASSAVVVRWFNSGGPRTPDPWGPEVEASIHSPEARPICEHCLESLSGEEWFCRDCGRAVGTYTNWMPYLYIFSQAEVLRTGVTEPVRRTPLVLIGYLFFSISCYSFFAPVYWYRLIQNIWFQGEERGEVERIMDDE